MNLILGKLMTDEDSYAELERLDTLIFEAREKASLSVSSVINACEVLSRTLNECDHLHLLLDTGMTENKARKELQLVKQILSKEYSENRIKTELGTPLGCFTPYGENISVRQEWKPLGVLLHIAAGNVDALPVFSVIEGLLTGNINILKLPGNDDGLSVLILQELIKIEPLIAQYVFVFDYPSHNVEAVKKMASASDAVVVWGGDSAVSAVRNMANPDTRIIEWGHKVSFAYVSDNASDNELDGVAYNICDTNQVFCNSCQGIFVDTDSFDEVVSFAERFLLILEHMVESMPNDNDPYLSAQNTLELYTERLESAKYRKRVFTANNCSVIAYDDMTLTPSYMYRNCWVRPLPRGRLLAELCQYKNHLNTAALICNERDKDAFETLLSKTGLVRITNGKRMSEGYCGMPHDGEFSLRRYMKIMSYED
ncbi:MAG: acyl-CoA reductase [Firmicutes bacterium HGW-Firmicutes-16]|nr:MAG: acyl-CoA reductase [Firmicutes bacterium HGW-Firmicutes-16]